MAQNKKIEMEVEELIKSTTKSGKQFHFNQLSKEQMDYMIKEGKFKTGTITTEALRKGVENV